MPIVTAFLTIASGLTATIYGVPLLGEKANCGDVGKAVYCDNKATTASGVKFDPTIPMAALAMPTKYRIKAQYIYIRTDTSKCHKVLLADKMHTRFVGSRGLDLTPAAVLLLGETPSKHWSKVVHICK